MKHRLIYAIAIVALCAMALLLYKADLVTRVQQTVDSQTSGDTFQFTSQIPADFENMHLRLYKAAISREISDTGAPTVHACCFILDRNTDLVVRSDSKPYYITYEKPHIIFHNVTTGGTKTFTYPDREVSDTNIERLVYRLRFSTTRERACRDLVYIGTPSAVVSLMDCAGSTESVIWLDEDRGNTAVWDWSRYDLGGICRQAISEIAQEHQRRLAQRDMLGNRPLTQQDKLDIGEAVYRYQFKYNPSEIPRGRVAAYYLEMFGKDPANAFLARFAGNVPPVRPASQYAAGGLRYKVDSISWSNGIATVRGGYQGGFLNAAGNEYTVIREADSWIVMSSENKWIS